MLREETVIDKIEVLENGSLQVREANRIYRDTELIAQTYHRHALAPGDDVAAFSDRVKAIASAVWTAEVLAAHMAAGQRARGE